MKNKIKQSYSKPVKCLNYLMCDDFECSDRPTTKDLKTVDSFYWFKYTCFKDVDESQYFGEK